MATPKHTPDSDGLKIQATFLLRLIKEKDIAEGLQQSVITKGGKPVSNKDAVAFIEDAIARGVKYLPERKGA